MNDVTQIDRGALVALPKVSLHDHLDGGLRPLTVLELAEQVGHTLPADEPEALGQWFADAADSGSLPRYLETFDHTVAVMQTEEALARVAREAVLDLAADGVIYAELRWAPEQHIAAGLTMQAAIDAVQAGIEDGIAQVTATGGYIDAGQIVTAMRHADRWDEVARLAVANRDRGVRGFDIAGAEKGFPADRFPAVWQYLADESMPTTIHAGEADGVESIAAAVHRGHAVRIGHGVNLVEDISWEGDDASLGRTARWVRDLQIPLELCPTSNVQTGAVASVAAHPITLLRDLDFAVTVNTDNRLMSATSLTGEMSKLLEQAGWDLTDLLDVTVAAAWSAFIDHDARRELAQRVIGGFAEFGIGTDLEED